MLLGLTGSALGAGPVTQPLTNGWKLARTPDVAQTGAQVSLASFNASSWVDAVVPGTVLTAYERAGLIPDPYYSTNMQALQQSKYYDTNFWYRNAFSVPASYAGQKIWLNFDAVNWYSDIYVNGTKLGSLNGPFKRGKFDITALVTTGSTNCVAVLLYWCNGDVPNTPTFIAVNSWDFMPAIPGRDVGLYQDVYLTTSGSVKLVDPYLKTDLPLPNTSPASLTLSVSLTNTSASAVSGTLSGTIHPEGIAFQTNLTVKANALTNFTFTPGSLSQLAITNPALWWPNGYGPQNLHTLTLSYQVGSTVSDTQSFNFGIREYSYDTTGNPLQVSCNGVKILCKGGNWGMPDAMLKYTPAQLDTAVRLHHEMNFTMIRCWHGTADLAGFYDACDKYGIMVWDEFWLNGSNYGLGPTNAPLFKTNVIDKIIRLRNRACLALYCGENEADPGTSLDNFFTNAIATLDGTRLFFPASNAKPVHGGGPYAVQDPYWYYTVNFNSANGFTSEIGLPSIPPLESLQAMMPASALWPIGNANWQFHDWDADIGNKGLGDYTGAINSRYGTATDITNFCEKAQYLNQETYKAIFESWNAKLWNDCSGVLLWMSQPAWPSTIWQTYDWYFETGGAYYGSRKGCEPIHIQWDHDNGSVKVVNATPQALTNLTATLQVYNLSGPLKFSTNLTAVNVPADSVLTCGGVFAGANLALNRPVAASSEQNTNNVAANAVDELYGTFGLKSTRWESQYSDPQWLYVDLGSPQNIDSVVILWEAYGKSYQIQTSLDATNWTTVWSTTTADGGYEASHFPPTDARYVRMYGTQRGTGWGYSIYEFKVYPTGAFDNGIANLTKVHFLQLQLKDSAGTVLSDNRYWRGTTPCDYTALTNLAPVSLAGYATATTDGRDTQVTVVLTNATSNVAFGNRLKLQRTTTGERVLPAFYSDNYFMLFPHEAKTVTIEFANADLRGDAPRLVLQGGNLAPMIMSVVDLSGPPAAPQNLAALAGTNHTVALSWSAGFNVSGYVVKRASVSGGPYAPMALTPAAAYLDVSPVNGRVYHYVVQATNELGASVDSSEVSAQPGGYRTWVLAAGALGYWPLNETSGLTAVDLLGANDGAHSAAVVLGAAGATGDGFGPVHWAAQYNGSNAYTQIPRLIGDTNFTIALWVKTTATGGTPNWYQGRGLVDGEMAGVTDDFGISLVGGQLALGIGNPDTTLLSSNVINDGAWHFVVATRHAGTGAMQLYVDGALAGTATGPVGPRTAPANLRIASMRTGASGRFLDGTISDVAVFDQSLTAPQISRLRQAGAGLFYDVTLSANVAGTNCILSWPGGGKLLEAIDLAGPWVLSSGTNSPQRITPSGKQKFYRVQVE